MIKSLLRVLVAGTVLGFAGTAAAEVELRNDHPDTYYVSEGDTLWDIASRFLESPWQWPELWHVSEDIENPHLIYPGDVIRLVYVDGRPHLQLERAEPVEEVKMMADGSVVKLKPEARVVSLDTAIPSIPLDRIQTFLLDALVVTPDEIEQAPYVVGGEDGRVIYGSGDRVYARDRHHSWENLGRNYGFYRVGEQYVDPATSEVLGYEALEIGLGRVTDHDGELATFNVIRAREDIRVSDRVFSTRERKMQSVFHPSAPSTKVEARIIRFFGRLSGVARNDVVVLNRGAREGIEDGNVLEVRRAGETVKDRVTGEMIRLPAETIGTLVVFRTFEKVSYALVVRSTKAIGMNDVAVNPLGSL